MAFNGFDSHHASHNNTKARKLKKCEVCDVTINQARLEVVPDTTMCVKCKESNESPIMGIMCYDHKTAPRLELVDVNTFKEINRLDRRGYKRVSRRI